MNHETDVLTGWASQPHELGAGLTPDQLARIAATIELRMAFIMLAAAARARALRSWAGGAR